MTKWTRISTLALVVLLAATLGVHAQSVWKVDKAHSSVGFNVRHMVVSKVNGSFTDFEGTINFDGKDLSGASVDFTIQATSVNTQNEKRDGHLRTPDFFAVDSFPTITFVSTKVIPGKGDAFQIVGKLTMRGVTKDVTFDAVSNGVVEAFGGKRAGFSATTTINRKDFNVNWSKTLDGGGLVVSDEVQIQLEIEAILEQPKVQG